MSAKLPLIIAMIAGTVVASDCAWAQDDNWKYLQCDGVATNLDKVNGVERDSQPNITAKFRFNEQNIYFFVESPNTSSFVNGCNGPDYFLHINETFISCEMHTYVLEFGGYTYQEFHLLIDRLSGKITESNKDDTVWNDTQRYGMGVKDEHYKSNFVGYCRLVNNFAVPKF